VINQELVELIQASPKLQSRFAQQCLMICARCSTRIPIGHLFDDLVISAEFTWVSLTKHLPPGSRRLVSTE
jgi:hypothetical protein